MRKIRYLLAIFFFWACGNSTSLPSAGKSIDSLPFVDTATAAQNPSSPLANIRSWVNAVNAGQLRSKRFSFTCDEPMVVDYFYRGDTVVKIVVDFGTVGDVTAREDYYYRNGSLVFFYERVEGGPACDTCIEVHEYRSYIHNNEVIRYRKDSSDMNCRVCRYAPDSRPYQLLSARDQQTLKKLFCPSAP